MSFDDEITITEWMKNQKVFITGVTGFIGKVLLYKLLKSCEVDVYVLLRSKKGKTAEERLRELLENPIFRVIKDKDEKILAKVKAIEGDVCQKRLGIQESDWKILQENVTSVFHVAASVRFDDSLKKAVFTNTRSTRDAILLARGMKNLKVFVHVSTAYTNCHHLNIPEEVVPTEFDPEKMIRIAETFDEHKLEVLSPRLLSDYPNTYIFTKNLAENLVYKFRNEIPVVIFRPAIVVSAVKEPEPGFCDNISGINALMTAAGKGVFRIGYGDTEKYLNSITVDSCANAAIVAGWYKDVVLSAQKGAEKNIVFNATDYRLTLGGLTDYFSNLQYTYPLKDQIWKCFVIYTRSDIYFNLMTIFLHVLPGFIIDESLKWTGNKPMLMKVYRKLHAALINLKPFMSNTFNFETKNFEILQRLSLEKDKKFFVDSFFETTLEESFKIATIKGRMIIGDPPEITKKDVERVNRLYWIDLITRVALVGLFIWALPLKSTSDLLSSKINTYQQAWSEFSESIDRQLENK